MHTMQESAGLTAPSAARADWRTILLLCAVASAPLYLAMDIGFSLLHDGYSYKDQTISELSAIGAPNRTPWVILGAVYAGLLVAGAVGIWMSAGDNRRLKVTAVLIGLVGILGFVGWPFAPMHQREVLAAGGGTLSDTLHLVIGGINSVLFLAMMGIAAWATRGWFRAYTIVTILLVIVFGALMGAKAPDVENNAPTPWLGIWERIAVEGSIVWISVFALALLRGSTGTPAGENT